MYGGAADTRDRREKARRLRAFVNDWCDAYDAALNAIDTDQETKP